MVTKQKYARKSSIKCSGCDYVHFNSRWDSFVKDHLRKISNNNSCLQGHYPHQCHYCSYVGQSSAGLDRRYDHSSNATCYQMREMANDPDILQSSTIITDFDQDDMDFEQREFVSAAHQSADATIGENVHFLDASTSSSRKIITIHCLKSLQSPRSKAGTQENRNV